MADFVLIHGTTQGPQGWDRLVDALTRKGHRGAAVDLLAGTVNGSVSSSVSSESVELAHYVETIQGQLPADISSPIVVAHSGSSVLLPATAQALNASRQVWLGAFVPDGQRSFVEEVRPSPTEVFNAEWLGKDPASDPVLATYFLFHDCNFETLQWALGTVRLFSPQLLYSQQIALVPGIPSTYIVGSRDRTLRPDWCRRESVRRLAAEVVELDTGHCPHVSKPEELATILDKITA